MRFSYLENSSIAEELYNGFDFAKKAAWVGYEGEKVVKNIIR